MNMGMNLLRNNFNNSPQALRNLIIYLLIIGSSILVIGIGMVFYMTFGLFFIIVGILILIGIYGLIERSLLGWIYNIAINIAWIVLGLILFILGGFLIIISASITLYFLFRADIKMWLMKHQPINIEKYQAEQNPLIVNHQTQSREKPISKKSDMTIAKNISPRSRFIRVQESTTINRENIEHPMIETQIIKIHDSSRKKWANAKGPIYNWNDLKDTIKGQGYAIIITMDDSIITDSRSLLTKKPNLHAPFVPFQTYYPTYRSLSEPQLEWYLRWRYEWIYGKPLMTDLSYLFLCTYELINFTIISDTHKSYRALETLYNEYRAVYPKLESYLIPWLGDMAWELGFRDEAINWWKQESVNSYKVVTIVQDSQRKLFSSKDIFEEYKYPTNAYIKNNENIIIPFFEKIAFDVNDFCIKKSGFTLKQSLSPDTKRDERERNYYQGAVFRRKILVPPPKEYFIDRNLEYRRKQIFIQFFKCIENEFRESHGTKRLLKVNESSLPAILRNYINERLPQHLDIEKFKNISRPNEQKKETITFDMNLAKQLYDEDELDFDNYKEEPKKEVPAPQMPIGIEQKENIKKDAILDLNLAMKLYNDENVLLHDNKINSALVRGKDVELPGNNANANIENLDSELNNQSFNEEFEIVEKEQSKCLLCDEEKDFINLIKGKIIIPVNEARTEARKVGLMLEAVTEQLNQKTKNYYGDPIIIRKEEQLIINKEVMEKLHHDMGV